MKVLFINREKSLWTGGDYIKLEKVAEGLRKLGVEVDISEKPLITPAIRIMDYDIVHVWNFSMIWSKYAVWMAGKWKRKIVSSMIYHDTEAFIPYKFQQVMMDVMDACIYETEGEIDRAKRHLTVKNSHIVPNGIDSWWFDKSKEKVPVEDYVLTVGRLEPNKGQLETARACREIGIQYVCIGGDVDDEYKKKVLAEGAIVFPVMKQEELKKWYNNCRVYIQPSSTETWGMAIDEAGSQGVPIVVSSGVERKDLPVIYYQYGAKKQLESAIREAMSQKNNLVFRDLLKTRTWDSVAADYKKIYEKII